MSKYAPGPWVNETGTIIASDNTVVCEVYGGDGRRFIDDEDNAICLANNNLITASPELLEVLERCTDFMASVWQSGRGPSKVSSSFIQTCKDARALITKAKGDSP